MKNIQILIVILLINISFSSYSQVGQRLARISEIEDEAIEDCSGPKYGLKEKETKMNLSLYAEYYKQKAYNEALPFWRTVFFTAPKSSENLYIRGAKMYKELIKNSDTKREERIDTLLAIADTRITCFGSSANLEKIKAFDWYTYRKEGNEAYVLDLFSNTYATYKKDSVVPPATFLVYWMNLNVKANKVQQIISADEVMGAYETVSEIIEQQLQGKKAGEYEGARQNIEETLLENNFVMDCDKVLAMIEKNYRANPDDETTIKKTYKKLKSFSCTDKPLFLEVANKLLEIQPSYQLYLFMAKKAKDAKETDKALAYYKNAIKHTENNTEKEKVLLKMASLYYNNGNFVKVRSVANDVLAINPNSGKAYLIIGRTYASSGKICGTGTDFKSHTIVWAAVDTWKKAKTVDSSVSSEAQKLINKYSQYMPTKKELFMNGISVGSNYTIDCFGITTKVRTSD